MPATKKRPPLELEPGEGKAHEMAESTNEELREGAEPDDAPRTRSRKRSAKGAKRTKAPMDGEACCAACAKGKPCSGKAKKDGGCSSGKTMADGECPMGKADCEGCPMKKSATDCATCSKRGDSLTPQEYLAACELGIQDRSKVYIRARLDAMGEPTGKSIKCGASHIPAGKKCTKGAGGAAAAKAGSSWREKAENTAVNVGGKIGTVATLGSIAAAVSGKQKLANALGNVGVAANTVANTGRVSRGMRTGNKGEAAQGAIGLGLTAGVLALQSGARGMQMAALKKSRTEGPLGQAVAKSTVKNLKENSPLSRARARKMAKGVSGKVSSLLSGGKRKATPRKPGGWRAPDRSLLDSAWADGFSPELDQLSV